MGSNNRYWGKCFRSKLIPFIIFYRYLFTFWTVFLYNDNFAYICQLFAFLYQLFVYIKKFCWFTFSAFCLVFRSLFVYTCQMFVYFFSCLCTIFQPLCFLMSSFDKLQKMKSFNVNLTENEAELWSRIFLIASTHFFLTTFLLSLWKNSFFHYWYCNAATLWCRNDITSMGIF